MLDVMDGDLFHIFYLQNNEHNDQGNAFYKNYIKNIMIINIINNNKKRYFKIVILI